MKPEPIYIKPGSFSIAGAPVERHTRDLEAHIDKLQVLLGDDLTQALAGMDDWIQDETPALISFTAAFTGVSTLLNFCCFARGIFALERGMETLADKQMVEKVRRLLIPIVSSQCEILGSSMALHTNARPPALNAWYDKATAEIQAVYAFVSRLAVE
jgi:hypothetical protein